MSDQHVGVRRRPSRIPVRRLAPLVAGLAVAAWALALGEPSRDAAPAPSPVSVVPTWDGPATVDLPGWLEDGATYTPRLYLSAQISVGVATTADGAVRVMLARSPGTFTTLRSRVADDHAQVNGFATDGDTLVWMESTARPGSTPSTTLWRTTLTSTSSPTQVTSSTGEVSFYGFQSDVVLRDGRVSWTALGTSGTEVRSVPVGGGRVEIEQVDGELLLTTPPWAVSVPGGPGTPVTLLDLSTHERMQITPAPDEAVVCNPQWCRISVVGATGLVGMDMMHPDGTQRRRIAGPEASPTIGDPALLGRFVPLAAERPDGVGLSLHDLSTGQTHLVAARAANVGGHGAILWWSTGLESELIWHALDLGLLT